MRTCWLDEGRIPGRGNARLRIAQGTRKDRLLSILATIAASLAVTGSAAEAQSQTNYSYDALGRLTGVEKAASKLKTSYAYDAADNRSNVTVQGAPQHRPDTNGDLRADLIWRNDSGAFSTWLGQPNGSLVSNDSNAYTTIDVAWKVAGRGDFNGDGKDDVLWRHDDGRLTNWLATTNGAFVINDVNAMTNAIPPQWKVAGTGDFNGDGRTDLVWRHTDGRMSDWLATPSGGYVSNDANALRSDIVTAWKIIGTGDFNRDGRDDLLWRHDDGRISDWLGTPAGGFIDNYPTAGASVAVAWKVVGTGDFNGDGFDDILWRHDTGTLTTWLGTSTGAFVQNQPTYQVAVDWKVADVADYNGDGRADIFWRRNSGEYSQWLAGANGAFIDNGGTTSGTLPLAWKVQGQTN